MQNQADRVSRANRFIAAVAHYSEVFVGKDGVGKIFYRDEKLYYRDPRSMANVFVQHVFGWRNFSGSESEKRLLIALKNYVEFGRMVSRKTIQNAVKKNAASAIHAADFSGIIDAK